MSHLSVSETARRISASEGRQIKPRTITMLFYDRHLREDICPIVGGHRIIPDNYVGHIVSALRRQGKLPRVPA